MFIRGLHKIPFHKTKILFYLFIFNLLRFEMCNSEIKQAYQKSSFLQEQPKKLVFWILSIIAKFYFLQMYNKIHKNNFFFLQNGDSRKKKLQQPFLSFHLAFKKYIKTSKPTWCFLGQENVFRPYLYFSYFYL